GSWRGKIAYLIARNVFGLLKEKFDPRAHNGGIFLGLNGLVIKSHGGTDEVGFAHAIDVGLEMARQKIINRIDADLKQYAQARAGAVKISREDETGQQKNTKVGVS
ncbi:MAG TPA: phosphate acyltransferase, partial [Alphaproteobacteria bacterium]|nr:phosphate acyltransferase [Alphaproteobacteria bacterium]